MKRDKLNSVFLIIASILCAIISGMLLFIPGVGMRTIVYICCVGMIVWGVAQLAKYFITEAYKKMHDYSFVIGTMFLILGCCGLVRASDIVAHSDAYLGLVILVFGIVLLQNVVQLKLVNTYFWIVELVISFLIILSAVFILADVEFFVVTLKDFTAIVLLVAAICNIISFPLVALMLHKGKKEDISIICLWSNRPEIYDCRYPLFICELS